jgi:undecaprenyl-diphosphatase
VSTLESIVLGIVQGLTEFLPISSTGHLRIVPALVGWDDPGAAFTAVTQLGTMAAVVLYFREELWRIGRSWLGSVFPLRTVRARFAGFDHDARMGWYILLATIPIGIFGLAFKDQIETGARNLYLIGSALIVVGLIMLVAEEVSKRDRDISQVNGRDGAAIGFAQTLALIPGVSRSGATIVGAMVLGLDRPAAAEFSFFLAMPTMTAAFAHDLLKARHDLGGALGAEIAIGLVMAFVAALVVVRPFLAFVRRAGFAPFAWYRILAGVVLLAAIAAGWV